MDTLLIFMIIPALILLPVYVFAFKKLPSENWQFFAAIPVKKNSGGEWQGLNITYYGVLTATGFALGFSVFLLMASSYNTGPWGRIAVMIILLIFFIPSAKVMAYIVEGKKHTLTVGGAAFVMIVAAPWVVESVNIFSNEKVSSISFMAMLLTAYAFGESFGRLACISFGCCYGRTVESMPSFYKNLFKELNFVFEGKTKKIAYNDLLDGVRVVPVQGITSILYLAAGFISLYFYYSGMHLLSFAVALTVTQLWRFLSEFLRADYRGNNNISPYQIMSIITIPYFLIYYYFAGTGTAAIPDIDSGLKFMWDPAIILIIQVMWLGALFYTGRSSVTASRIKFYVVKENI
jgi:hypothetical protein